MQIQNIQSYSCNFQGKSEHLPKTFAGMMNRLYKKAINQFPDTFENSSTIKLSVGLDDGKIASGYANFCQGQYVSFNPDNDCPIKKNEFIKLLLKKYKLSLASEKVKGKLGY